MEIFVLTVFKIQSNQTECSSSNRGLTRNCYWLKRANYAKFREDWVKCINKHVLDGNYTRMLRAILNKSWRQHPIKHQLYGHLPPITKTIQARQTRHCRRSKDELIRDVLLSISGYHIYQPLRSGTIWHKVNF